MAAELAELVVLGILSLMVVTCILVCGVAVCLIVDIVRDW